MGAYGERFGRPEFSLTLSGGIVTRVQVLRGAPCGATWEAACRIEGLKTEEASVRIGLYTQFFCTANPAGWDPIGGKSPVHYAGDLHAAAFHSALRKSTPLRTETVTKSE